MDMGEKPINLSQSGGIEVGSRFTFLSWCAITLCTKPQVLRVLLPMLARITGIAGMGYIIVSKN